MKKVLIALAFVGFLGFTGTSCKSKKHCEAYGTSWDMPKPKAEKNS